MNHARDAFDAVQRRGIEKFSHTSLAHDHSAVTRGARRGRAARGALAGVAGVALVLGGTFGVMALNDRGLEPMIPASPTPVPSTPSPPPSDLDPVEVTIQPGELADEVIARAAHVHGVTAEQMRTAVVAALPAEADGVVEGWIPVGVYLTDHGDLDTLAQSWIDQQISVLEDAEVAREQWQETLVRASIVEAEIASADPEAMSGVARVISHRLAEDMELEVESPLQYYVDMQGLDPSDDGWLIDTPYNTFMHPGLPPTPIGNPSIEAIRAVADEADEDWLYFVSEGGTTLFATTFHEHQLNLVELGLIDEGDVLPEE